MLEEYELQEKTLDEILALNKGHKMKAIEMLIEQIAEDEFYNALIHFETEQEQKEYLNYISK